jgi:8-oxo-dGTP diphosphatase
MKQLLGSIGLFILAIIIYIIILPCSIIHSIIKFIISKEYIKILLFFANFFKSHALGINQTSNRAFNVFFNDIMIKDDSIHSFGDIDETLSSVLGKNKLKNNLTIFGSILDFILTIFDENHTIKSIDKQ